MDLKKKKVVVADGEFDSLNPTKLWCLVTKEYPSGKRTVYRFDEPGSFDQLRKDAKHIDVWVGHKFNTYDSPNLFKLEGVRCYSVIDTLVVSRLLYPARPGGHSIENLGKKHGKEKETVIKYDDPKLIETYVKRCISDVEIGYDVFVKDQLRYITDGSWDKAIDLEHRLDLICQKIHENGFSFDLDKAEILFDQLNTLLSSLTKEIQDSVGPVYELSKVVTFRRNKDGYPDKRSKEFIKLGYFDDTADSGSRHSVYIDRPFNPGSPKDRINLLNEAGWKPTVKTDTHRKLAQEIRNKKRFGRKVSDKDTQRLEKLTVSGWKVCEENLETLPEDSPEGAKKLAQWLTLEGRVSDLKEWIQHCRKDTQRIHGEIIHIGGWTERCTHRKPNVANIFSEFHGEVNSPIKEIKNKYDGILRSLWRATPGWWLVGTDAEGIQLRILGHLMEDEEYIRAVQDGDKALGTDVHTLNKIALQLPHLTRDHAKTFIYAWLLGASHNKVAQILECSYKEAVWAVDKFVSKYPGLKRLKEVVIPQLAQQGWFTGLDGRKVICDSEHLMLAGLLQNGEKIIMAKANVIWDEILINEKVTFREVDFVHDEWQTETPTFEEAELVARVQREAITQAGEHLDLLVRLDGSSDIGRNWLETH